MPSSAVFLLGFLGASLLASSSSAVASSMPGGGKQLLPAAAPGPPRAQPFPPAAAAAWRPVSGSWLTPALSPLNSSWEGMGVQEPQIIYQCATKSLRMWYRGAGWANRAMSLGVADSFDGGVTWKRHAYNPLPVKDSTGKRGWPGQPWIYKESPGKYWLYFTESISGHGVGIATSPNG